MKKQRLVAAVLAGSMVFSSVSYAGISGQDSAEYLQSVETQNPNVESGGEQTEEDRKQSVNDTTEENADEADGAESQKDIVGSEEKTEETDTVDDEKPSDESDIIDGQQDSEETGIVDDVKENGEENEADDEKKAEEIVKADGANSEEDAMTTYPLATDSNATPAEDEIPDEDLVSEIQQPENTLQSNPAQLQEVQNVVKIRLLKDKFSKGYGQKDPKIYTLYDGDYEFVEGGTDWRSWLTNIKYEREEGEKPGRYKITSLTCTQYPEIELEEESAWFTINKFKIGAVVDNKKEIPDDGKEQSVDIAATWNWKDEKKPSRIILQELSAEDKAKFVKVPFVDEAGVLHFTLKQLGDGGTVTIPFTAEGEYYIYPETIKLIITTRKSTLKTVETHTPEEIKAFYREHPFSTSTADTWTVTPNAKNGVAGELSEKTVKNALNSLNFVRYIAGLDADVVIQDDYAEAAQAGTTLLMAVGKLNHTPEKPASVSQEFYELGYSGTSASNLGRGHSNLAEDVIDGWMEDGDSSNIDRVGHRRWCLNPSMKATGFGHSGTYTAMYSFDGMWEECDISYVPWPSQTMPIDYFKGPWSLSLNSEELKVPDKAALKVTLTKQNGSSVVLDSSNKNKSGKYLNYDNGGYGMGPAIIFQPLVSYSASDMVTVKVEGVQDKYGNDVPLEYTVNFFRMRNNSTGGSSGGGGGSSSGGGGGSSSGGGAGSSSGGGGGGSASKLPAISLIGGPGNSSLPSYVVKGTWKQSGDKWHFSDTAGNEYKNTWAAVENPYADTTQGQSAFDWFRFDEAGQMQTGWVTEPDGNIYYLNPVSDNTRGKMQTGWVWIPDANGVQKCYYFNPNSDGFRGRLLKDTVIDGNTVNAEGAWVVNGVVQTK